MSFSGFPIYHLQSLWQQRTMATASTKVLTFNYYTESCFAKLFYNLPFYFIHNITILLWIDLSALVNASSYCKSRNYEKPWKWILKSKYLSKSLSESRRVQWPCVIDETRPMEWKQWHKKLLTHTFDDTMTGWVMNMNKGKSWWTSWEARATPTGLHIRID